MTAIVRFLILDLIFPEPIRLAVARNLARIVGAGLILLALALLAALATWSAQDPSLNQAARRTAQNLLGYPGAVSADLLMQTFGLASALLLIPLFRLGWLAFRGHGFSRARLRIMTGILGICAASGLAATLPHPQTWPLPSSLGGFFGDWLLNMPFALLGLTPGTFSYLIAGACFAWLTLRLFALSTGLSWADFVVEKAPRQDAEDDAEWDEDEEDDRRSFLGGVFAPLHYLIIATLSRLHWGLRMLAPRRIAGGYDFSGLMFWKTPADPDDGRTLPDGRIEPHFMPGAEARSDGWDDDEYAGEYDGIDGPPVPGGKSYHVEARAPGPRPGQRMQREAQPSLLAGKDYQLPHLRLLAAAKDQGRRTALSAAALEQNARLLEGVLGDFGVKGEIINVRPGPVVTLYELEPAPGIKSSRVIGLADDIARSMSAVAARVAVVPGRNVIGIELPNPERELVILREILASEDYEKAKQRLPLALGKTIGGEAVITDLARMPHLLIAGTTGSGKSVGINTMILSLLFRLTPEQCRLIMIDPKMLELSVYDGIPHLLAPVVTDPKKAVVALKWTVKEMEERYKRMSRLGVRNIDGYNQRVRQAAESGEILTRTVQTGFDRDTGEALFETEEMNLEPMPYLVVIVDEMADLMMVAGKDIEGAIQRLAQMARAAGIHMITATQRPSVDVITGTIKANFPTRISFQVTSKIDSRTILGEQGAEQLLGQGDMLYMAGGGRISRVHGPFVSDEDVERVVRHLKKQGVPDYLDAVTDEDDEDVYDPLIMDGGDDSDDLYRQAVQIVLRDKKASTSYVQRRLSIGYNRAATIIERMENEGLISAANHAGKREILTEGAAE